MDIATLFFLLVVLISILLAKIYNDERIITFSVLISLSATALTNLSYVEALMLIPVLYIPVFLIQSKSITKRKLSKDVFIFVPFYSLMIFLGKIKSGESIAYISTIKKEITILEDKDLKYIFLCLLLLLATFIIRSEVSKRNKS